MVLGLFAQRRSSALQLPNDPQIRARIYVQKEEARHPMLEAAIGHEWSYAGGFSTPSTKTPARANAGAMGVNHAKLHAEVARVEQRKRFTISAAESGMLEIGSDAFNARFPIGTVVTRGTIGEDMLRDLPVKLLVRDGEKLVEVEGKQAGARGHFGPLLVAEAGGKTREIPFDTIEVAFAADPRASSAQARVA